MSAGLKTFPILAPAKSAATNGNSSNGKRKLRDSSPAAAHTQTTSGKNLATVTLTQPVISPSQIPIAQDLIEGHWLRDYITKESPIETSVDLNDILKTIENTIDIKSTDGGGIPASTNEASEYKDRAWRRDAAIVDLAMFKASDLETERPGDREDLIRRAVNRITQQAMYDNQPFHRGHFTSFFFLHSAPAINRQMAKEKYRRDINGLPRQVASITADGGLGEYFDWGHNQNDGLGADHSVVFHAANTGKLN